MGQQSSKRYSLSEARWGSERENERLLQRGGGDLEQVDQDGCFPPHGIHDICMWFLGSRSTISVADLGTLGPANPYADLPVYTTIHRYILL